MTVNREPRISGVLIETFFTKSGLDCNVGSLKSLGAVLYIKCNLLAFRQGFKTRALDNTEMYEYVFTAIIRGNETKALGFVKPLNSTCSHNTFTF